MESTFLSSAEKGARDVSVSTRFPTLERGNSEGRTSFTSDQRHSVAARPISDVIEIGFGGRLSPHADSVGGPTQNVYVEFDRHSTVESLKYGFEKCWFTIPTYDGMGFE